MNCVGIQKDWKKVERAFEDKMASTYDAKYYGSYLEQYYLNHFASFVANFALKTDIILDVGCGTGNLEAALLEKGYRNVTGVDLSPQMIQQAQMKHFKSAFLAADGEFLPFNDGHFDIVICSSILHHLPTLSPLLKEIKRVLKEHGSVILREPGQEHHFSTPSWLSGAVLTLMRYIYRIERFQPVDEPAIHQYHRAFQVNELLSELQAHFFVLHFSTQFPFSCHFTKIKRKAIVWPIIILDRFLKHQSGSQIYAAAANYESNLAGVSDLLGKHIDQLACEQKEPKSFLLGFYFLLWIVKIYEKLAK